MGFVVLEWNKFWFGSGMAGKAHLCNRSIARLSSWIRRMVSHRSAVVRLMDDEDDGLCTA